MRLLAYLLAGYMLFGFGLNVRAQSHGVTCASLQFQLLALSASETLQLPAGTVISCVRQPDFQYKDATFDTGLLVPEGVILDLNGGEIQLILDGEATYGVRLARFATIRNGHVRVVSSESAGSQGIWHSAISVGAAYGHGGTPANPSYFSKVGHWTIQNVQITQPFSRAAIGIIGEAHNGLIEGVTIRSSAQALVGIGMDWGTVGEVSANREEISRMKEMYLAGLLYTTHPHDITVRNVTIEHLTRVDDDDRSGIRTSAVYNVRIENVLMHEVGSGIVFRAGDLGFEFAHPTSRPHAHSGLVAENFRINHAHRRGVIVDGFADNVYDAYDIHGYDWLLDPRLPGMRNTTVRFGFLRGAFQGDAGIFVQNASGLVIEDVDVQSFTDGVRIERGTRNSTLWRSSVSHNLEYGIRIHGHPYRTEAALVPDNLAFVDNEVHSNGIDQFLNVNATNLTCLDYYCTQ